MEQRDLPAEDGAERLARRRRSRETCPQKMEQRDLPAEDGAERLARRRRSRETCPQKTEQRDLPAEDGENGEERLGGVGGVGLG